MSRQLNEELEAYLKANPSKIIQYKCGCTCQSVDSKQWKVKYHTSDLCISSHTFIFMNEDFTIFTPKPKLNASYHPFSTYIEINTAMLVIRHLALKFESRESLSFLETIQKKISHILTEGPDELYQRPRFLESVRDELQFIAENYARDNYGTRRP